MALTVPSGRIHTDSVVAVLRDGGLTVGDGSGLGLDAPYAVVYTDLGLTDGPIGDRFADLEQAVFVHGVGVTAEQAQWVGDKARVTLLTASLTVTDRTVLYVDLVTSQPVQRDDDIQPPMFYTVDQYTLATTPA